MNTNTPLAFPARVALVTATGAEIEPPNVVVPAVALYAQMATLRLKITSYVPPFAPESLAVDTTLAPRALAPVDSRTAHTFFRPHVIARWKLESSATPVRLTIFTNTPFWFPARPATEMLPGDGTDPAPVVPIVAL